MCLLHVLPKIEGKEVHCIIGQEARPGAEESKAALYSLLLPLSAICLLHVLPKIACLNSMNTCNGLVLWVHITHLVDWRWRHCMQDRIWGKNICQNFHLFSFMHECLRRDNTEMAWKFFMKHLIWFYPCSRKEVLERSKQGLEERERRRRRRPHLTSAAPPQRGHKPVRPGPSHSSHVTRSTSIPVGAVSLTELNTCQCVDGKVWNQG